MWLAEVGSVTGRAVSATLESHGVTTGDPVLVLEDLGDLDLLAARVAAGDQVLVITTPESPLVDPWLVLEAGGADLLGWSGADTAASVVARLAAWRSVDAAVDSAALAGTIRGRSVALRRSLRELVVAATSGSAPILITGETGTGKELAARAAHALARADRAAPFIVLDCTTIVPSLSGSELFGHERGAFTGAVSSRAGAAAAANGGTLFLDEIGELPLDLQAALLRLIQEGTYKRVGGDEWLRSRFRLVAATNRDLGREVDGGRFRRDLYHRLAAVTVTLPPLSDRREDIVPLFAGFLATAGVAEPVRLDPAVEAWLTDRPYPGNVRELKQLAERVSTRHPGSGPVTVGAIPPGDRPPPRPAGPDPVKPPAPANHPGTDAEPEPRPDPRGGEQDLARAVDAAVQRGIGLRDLKENVAMLAVESALRAEGGSVAAAARRLRITDRAVQLRRAAAREHPPDAAA